MLSLGYRLGLLGHIGPFPTFPNVPEYTIFFTPVFFLILQGIITCILQDACCAWHGNILSRRAGYLDAAEKSTESEGYLAVFKCLFQVFPLHHRPKRKVINETNKMSPQSSVTQNAPESSVACPALAMAFSPTSPARVLPFSQFKGGRKTNIVNPKFSCWDHSFRFTTQIQTESRLCR